MSDGRASGIHWRRCAAFVAVAAFHAALFGMLLRISQTTQHADDDEIVSSLILLPSSVSRPTAARSPLAPRVDAHLQRIVPRDFAPEAITYPADDDLPALDWTAAARKVAADVIKRSGPAAGAGDGTPRDAPPEHGSIFPAPTHHADEEYQSAEGDSIVWVSERCYIDSAVPDLALPSALAHSALPRTVCPGNSKEARGDLFEALPAYRKRRGSGAD